jgi:hypothetical protein
MILKNKKLKRKDENNEDEFDPLFLSPPSFKI